MRHSFPQHLHTAHCTLEVGEVKRWVMSHRITAKLKPNRTWKRRAIGYGGWIFIPPPHRVDERQVRTPLRTRDASPPPLLMAQLTLIDAEYPSPTSIIPSHLSITHSSHQSPITPIPPSPAPPPHPSTRVRHLSAP